MPGMGGIVDDDSDYAEVEVVSGRSRGRNRNRSKSHRQKNWRNSGGGGHKGRNRNKVAQGGHSGQYLTYCMYAQCEAATCSESVVKSFPGVRLQLPYYPSEQGEPSEDILYYKTFGTSCQLPSQAVEVQSHVLIHFDARWRFIGLRARVGFPRFMHSVMKTLVIAPSREREGR